MYTQCSSCATLFRVSARHLREAQGRVRCCLCRETFNALPSLTETLPPGLPVDDLLAGRSRIAAAAAAASTATDVVDEPAEPEPAEPMPVEMMAAAPIEQADETLAEEAASAERDLFTEIDLSEPPEPPEPPEPSAPVRRPRRPWAGLAWALGCLLLLALLVVQYGYSLVEQSIARVPGQRAQADYVRDPRYRPGFELVCLIARCELPLLRDVNQVHILQRRVMAHPAVPKALLVTATLVNDASFRQPFPQLKLSFLDASGRERASRWFAPQEYLEGGLPPEALLAGMPPKQPVAVRLELADPGKGAAEGFEIDFR